MDEPREVTNEGWGIASGYAVGGPINASGGFCSIRSIYTPYPYIFCGQPCPCGCGEYVSTDLVTDIEEQRRGLRGEPPITTCQCQHCGRVWLSRSPLAWCARK